jgi:hypothetical protein
MARINIEDSLFKDARFIDLCIYYGDKAKALGVITWAFVVAQKYYLSEESARLIPLSEWKRQQCDDKLIEIGLAEMRPEGIYVSGSEDQFAWLIQKQQAGKKGGRPKSNIKEKRKAGGYRAKAEESGSNPLTLTPSLTPTLSLSQAHSQNISERVKNAPSRASGGTQIWEAYREAYKTRYGVEPVRNATTNSQCNALHKRLGESAIEVVRFYLTHNDGYYLRSQHPIGLALAQAESLHTQWQRGVAVTSTQVRNAEKTINNAETLQALRKQFGE